MNSYNKALLLALGALVLVIGMVVILHYAGPAERAMNGEAAKAMADRIGQAKPGAIMVFRDGTPAHVEWAQGKWSHGNVSYNVFGGIHNLTDLQYMGHKIIAVVDQGDPDRQELYKELLYAYARGDRFDPRRLRPPH